MSAQSLEGRSLRDALAEQGRVIAALMLRDIKTRFFGSGLGYLLYIAWPLSHILLIVLIFGLGGRLTPYGDSAYLWVATGTAPFMCFSYSSRYIMLAYMTNRPLLMFPVVKVMDLVIARAILEALTAALIIAILIAIFFACGVDPLPQDTAGAFCALAACVFLGVGIGTINAVIAAVSSVYVTIYALVIVVLWATSGVVFVPDFLPEQLRDVLSYNPILHGILWLRAAYYPDYGSLTLDKPYLVAWAAGSLFAGLALERLVRGRLP